MILRANPRVVIESSNANGNFIALRPIAAKQARAAGDTKCFYCALSFAVNANQIFTAQQTELLLLHARLRAHRGPGMFSAALAVTMSRANEGRRNLEAHSAAQATSSNSFSHELLLLGRGYAIHGLHSSP